MAAQQFPDNVLEMINAHMAGYDKVMGLAFTKATPDEFVLRLFTFYFPGWRAYVDGAEVEIEVAGP